VGTSDSSGPLPTGTVVVSNAGTTNPMFCNVNGLTATVSDQPIPPSSWFGFAIPSGATTLHCIATGAATTANGGGFWAADRIRRWRRRPLELPT
jgi:hypothetical protein